MAARVWCWTPNPVLEIKFSHRGCFVSAGGKAHNVARQLRCWGVPVVSVVAEAGPEWIRQAKRDGTRIRVIPVPALARTGWAFINGPGQRLDFFTPDPRWTHRDWSRCRHYFLRNVRKGEWLVVAGSVPQGARRGWWRTLFSELRNNGVRVLVDGKGPLLREALAAGVEWAKANLSEAEETLMCRGGSGCLDKMKKLSGGRSCLMITRGSRGLVLRAGQTNLTVPSPKIRLQDATGAGDVVTAALMVGIRKNWEIGKIARFAAWAGAEQAATRDGAVGRLMGRGVFR